MNTFKYGWSEKVKQVIMGVVLLTIINSILSNEFNWKATFLVGIGFSIFVFFLLYAKVLFEQYSVTEEGIIISHFYKKRAIPFSNIKRIIIREEDHSFFGKSTIMTITLNIGRKKKIIVSALKNASSFIQLLEQQSSFKTIQQDSKGNIIRSIL